MDNFTIDEFEEIVAFAKERGMSDADARRQLFSYFQGNKSTYTACIRRIIEVMP